MERIDGRKLSEAALNRRQVPEALGYTPQKPLQKAYEQSPVAVGKWLVEQYPAITKRAKQEHAEIHWGDEAGLRSDDVRDRGNGVAVLLKMIESLPITNRQGYEAPEPILTPKTAALQDERVSVFRQ